MKKTSLLSQEDPSLGPISHHDRCPLRRRVMGTTSVKCCARRSLRSGWPSAGGRWSLPWPRDRWMAVVRRCGGGGFAPSTGGDGLDMPVVPKGVLGWRQQALCDSWDIILCIDMYRYINADCGQYGLCDGWRRVLVDVPSTQPLS